MHICCSLVDYINVTTLTRVKYDPQVFSNTLICPFLSPSYFSPFFCTFSFCVMRVCTQYWCWSYVFSAFAFFSYCLPGLFGSSSSQSVCYFLNLLRVYICVSIITSHQKVVVGMHHELSFCWISLMRNVLFFQFLYVNCAHLFMGLRVFPLVVLSPW